MSAHRDLLLHPALLVVRANSFRPSLLGSLACALGIHRFSTLQVDTDVVRFCTRCPDAVAVLVPRWEG